MIKDGADMTSDTKQEIRKREMRTEEEIMDRLKFLTDALEKHEREGFISTHNLDYRVAVSALNWVLSNKSAILFRHPK